MNLATESGTLPHAQLGALANTLLPEHGNLLEAFKAACRQRPDLAAAAVEAAAPARVRSRQTTARPPRAETPADVCNLPPPAPPEPPPGGAAPAAAVPQVPAADHFKMVTSPPAPAPVTPIPFGLTSWTGSIWVPGPAVQQHVPNVTMPIPAAPADVVGATPVPVIARATTPGTPEHFEVLKQMRSTFTSAMLAENTRKGYRLGFAAFERWAETMGLASLPATTETVALFVLDQLLPERGLKVTTVSHRVSAIRRKHLSAKHASPVNQEIYDLLTGARRDRGDELRQVLPITIEELTKICTLLLADTSPVSVRNRALLLVQFSTAQRNANTAAFRLEDVTFSEQGASLKIIKSKTDQEGKGRLVGIPFGKHEITCPVRALQKWIEYRGAAPGPLFTRFDGSSMVDRHLRPPRVGQIVQEQIARLGLDPKLYGGHSLRSGMITAAGTAGATDLNIAGQTGHVSMTTLRRYFRKRDAFVANPIGLLNL